MAHDKTCQNCGKPFTGNISKRFCSDACRKYYKRHGEVSLANPNPPQIPDYSGQKRTSSPAGGHSVFNYALKKSIDFAAKYAENTLIPPKSAAQTSLTPAPNSAQPLISMTAQDIIDDPLEEFLLNLVELPADWQAFLGAISYPFKMLVWGLPGSGKSSFCMQLANHLGRQHRLLYIAGEEELTSRPMVDKQRRLMTNAQARQNSVFVDRLPGTTAEWQQVGTKTATGQALLCQAIFYDSVTVLDISPFYVKAAAREYKLEWLEFISHIFITHAHKDGQQYRGDGSWGHEVDVVIRVEQGVAITEKNRFGEVGGRLAVF